MAEPQTYLASFGQDPLKRLHGCAVAEAGRGAESPCAGLASSSRRPQLGLGNPKAPIVFVSPSPIDPRSAQNEPFGEWLAREAGLEHHLTSETVQPYFDFVRSVLREMRRRWKQEPEKHDAMELAFHTWLVRCPTENPDRVTDAAAAQCSSRHLDGLLATLSPRAIVALGGPAARHFWYAARRDWKGWRPVERLHGTVLSGAVAGIQVPVVISVQPKKGVESRHPEVIGRALSSRVSPQDIATPLGNAA
jgi:uracil-DNA glycosylase